jgi:hypothetical protein
VSDQILNEVSYLHLASRMQYQKRNGARDKAISEDDDLEIILDRAHGNAQSSDERHGGVQQDRLKSQKSVI